jgi:hypothetical protein
MYSCLVVSADGIHIYISNILYNRLNYIANKSQTFIFSNVQKVKQSGQYITEYT